MWRSALFAVIVHISGLDGQCPENVVCTTTLDPDSCPAGTYYRENVKAFSCCPGCVKLRDFGEDCNDDKDCKPGLYCGRGLRQCVADPLQSCIQAKETITYWTPNCLPNGKFASKQCKGEIFSGKCFCTDEEGVRIFGENEYQKAVNMTCRCSRLADTLRKQGKGLSLHCDDNGNFEDLQCENGVCWCSNERTGIPYSVVVPEIMIRALPCFDDRTFGSQYLRKCDSMMVHTHLALKLLADHGTGEVVVAKSSCNYDGSYARLQYRSGKSTCMYKHGKQISYSQFGKSTCNCAYDRFVATELNQGEFHLECTDLGDYKSPQSLGDKEFGVDADGFRYSL